jgi:putative transferase (TIGR04331 family)
MVKRLLVTTALEESWSGDEPVLFLGEWCRQHSRKERWSRMNAEVMPYHWDDRQKLHDDYVYLLEFHERLLQDLTNQLNKLHGVDHTLRYWRILIGPWLGYFTQILFDRWFSIHNAVDRFDLSGTVILDGLDAAMVPNDMADFPDLFVDDEWNHFLYATILEKFTDVPLVKRNRERVDSMKSRPLSWRGRLKKILADAYAWWMYLGIRNQDAFLLNTYLSRADEKSILQRLGQKPQYWRMSRAEKVPMEETWRNWEVSGDNRSEFEVCARALIPLQMPTAYLEGYAKLVERSSAQHLPKDPKLIWTCNSHIADEVFKAWAAAKVEQGTPLVVGQHGGLYGIARWIFVESHEIAICDRYLTWGWSELNQDKCAPVGQLKPRRLLGRRQEDRTGALLVTNIVPRYSYWMCSISVSRQWLDYFDEQCAFVEKLPDEIRDVLTVRLHPLDYGWNQYERWKERFPGLVVDAGETDMDDLIQRSKLYISTYNATTYLESFAMDMPTVVYWDPKHWELRDSAIPYFEDLQRVGIFHETPASAAAHVATIWENIDAWWGSSAVREVLNRFKARYCATPDDLLTRVEYALKEAMVASRDSVVQ